MNLSIFENDQTMGAAAPIGKVTFRGQGLASRAFSEGIFEEKLKADLRSFGISFRSVDFNRALGTDSMAFVVTIDRLCSHTVGELEEKLLYLLNGNTLFDRNSVAITGRSATGCTSTAPTTTPKPGAGADPPPEDSGSFTDWIKAHQTEVIVGVGLVLVLLTRRQ